MPSNCLCQKREREQKNWHLNMLSVVLGMKFMFHLGGATWEHFLPPKKLTWPLCLAHSSPTDLKWVPLEIITTFLQIMYPACTKLHPPHPACSCIPLEELHLQRHLQWIEFSWAWLKFALCLLVYFPFVSLDCLFFMEADFSADQNPKPVLWRPLDSLLSNHFRHLSSKVCSATRHYSGLWEFLGHLC